MGKAETLSAATQDFDVGTADCSAAQARWREELAQLKAAGLQVRYPWELFFRSTGTLLERGLDFHGSPARMQGQLTNAAWRRGLRVRTGATAAGDVRVHVLGPIHRAEASEAGAAFNGGANG